METTIEIKKKIYDFIEDADERILRIINAIITTEQEKTEYEIPESFYEELDRRREAHLSGKSKSYTWEEVKERARKRIEAK